MSKYAALAALVSFSCTGALAAQTVEAIQADLQKFNDPSTTEAFMWTTPAKRQVSGPSYQRELDGKTVDLGVGHGFPEQLLEDQKFVKIRGTMRQKKFNLPPVGPNKAAIEANDRAERLVDAAALIKIGSTTRVKHNTLESMEKANLRAAGLVDEKSPWSDDYWAIYTGILGKRYADPSFPESGDWKKNEAYVLDQLFATSSNTDILSPAEKYDLIVGDKSKSLTRRMFSEGEAYWKQSGDVESWMGICHGWSPAAYLFPRPAKMISVKAADGSTIRLYPSDVKALASLLFANGSYRSKFIGGRCNTQSPATEPGTGRIIAQECFDNNPGTFHLALVNQLGVAKRSFVMDATYDYQVWNQPLLSYGYDYFKPGTEDVITAKGTAGIEAAKVTRKSASEAFPGDKFGSHRSPKARALVGVAMNVTYIAETNPTTAKADSYQDDARVEVTYYYDLELDENGVIVGGEWYQNEHPDFLWNAPEGTKVRSIRDSVLKGAWLDTANESVPQQWQAEAPAASAKGQPLAAVVNALMSAASKQ